MKINLKITGGTVVDPKCGRNGSGDVLIHGNTIVEAKAGESGDSITMNDWLLPQMTVKDGKIVYRPIDFQ